MASPDFAGLIARVLGPLLPAQGYAAACRPWVDRGIDSAARRLQINDRQDHEVVALWSFAFEAGAQDAIHLARTVLSDPSVKGHEMDALAMIEQGLSHADIVAALSSKRSGGSVVSFRRLKAPANDSRKL